MLDGLLPRLRGQWKMVQGAQKVLVALAALIIGVAAATGTISGFLRERGFGTALIVLTYAALVVVVFGLLYLARREEWGRLLSERNSRFGKVPPARLGIARPGDGPSDELPAYVLRDVDPVLRERMAERHRQLLLVVGHHGSGASRTAYEALAETLSERARVHVLAAPTEACPEPLPALLANTLPWRWSRGVLWLDELGEALENGNVRCGDVEGFLDRHRDRRLKIVAVMRADEYLRLIASDDRRLVDMLNDAIACDVIQRDFSAAEQARAEKVHPDIPRPARRRLAEHFKTSQIVNRFAAERDQLRRAVVCAAADWTRCGATVGATFDFLKTTCREYLHGAARRFTDEEFDEAFAEARSEFRGGPGMIRAAEEGEGWVAAPALISDRDKRRVTIPPGTWERVIETFAENPQGLVEVAEAARDNNEPDVARKALSRVGDTDPAPASEKAAQMRLSLADEGHQMTVMPALLRRTRRGRVVRDLLRSVDPAPVPGTEGLDEEEFDPSEPDPVEGGAAGLYRRRAFRFALRTFVLAVLDAVSVLAGLALALLVKAWFRDDTVGQVFDERSSLALYCVGFALPMLMIAGAYRTDSRRARIDRISFAFFASAALAAIAGLLHGEDVIKSTTAWASFFFGLPLCFLVRLRYDRTSQNWVRKHGLHTRVLFFGDRVAAEDAKWRLRKQVGRPMRFVGYLDKEDSDDEANVGRHGNLEDVLAKFQVRHVVIADTEVTADDALGILDRCVLHEVTLDMVMSLEEMQVHRRKVPPGGTIALQRLKPLALGPFWSSVKTTCDRVIAFVLLVLSAPLMLAIAAAIWWESRRPVLVRSYRPGFGGEVFGMWKFRTTRRPRRGRGEAAASRDPMTQVGKFLTLFSLDELPQFWNVLRGDMSLVGPRPVPTDAYEKMQPRHQRRYLVKPGMTGPWQLEPRGPDLDLDELARVDLVYAQSWSIWRDLEILLRTAWIVMRRIWNKKRRPWPFTERATG